MRESFHLSTISAANNMRLCVALLFLLIPQIFSEPMRCLQTSRFYRNSNDCSKYYLCIDGEVFEFQCSNGLLFDVDKQICNFSSEVRNCAVAVAFNLTQSACADGMVLPARYFCDGSEDCGDGSDESGCNGKIDPFAVGVCEENKCKLPDCFCSKDGKQVPRNLNGSEVPQMVLLTFEDVVSYENWNVLKGIFTETRKNPNGCPIGATFFVSHNNSNYQQLQKLWNDGHEIAVHSVTHGNPENWTLEDWFDEMIGQANILNRFANVRASEIRGMRAPFLKIGGNRQFLMMKEFGLVYDSSIKAPYSNGVPLWPYTLDYKPPHICDMQNCPTRSYPSIWEMVLNEIHGLGYILEATSSLKTKDETFQLLLQSFERHYRTNRAPFGLHIRLSWLEKKDNLAALNLFLDKTLSTPNVFFVTNFQAIQWIQKPTIKNWFCNRHLQPQEIVCGVPNVCKIEGQNEPFYTCSECPKKYPWFRNEFGIF